MELDWIGFDIAENNRRTIWRSTNKGETWTKGRNDQDENIGGFFSFVITDVGFLVNKYGLLKTIDGEHSWASIHKFRDDEGSNPFFATKKIGWVSGATWVSRPTKHNDMGLLYTYIKQNTAAKVGSSRR